MKEYLIERLKNSPSELEKAEKNYLDSLMDLRRANFNLIEKESELIRSGKIDGKAEKIRNAQMLQYTKDLEEKIINCEKLVNEKKVIFHRIKRECDHLQYISRLI